MAMCKASLFHYRNQLLSLVHCSQLLPSPLFLSKNVSLMYYDSIHRCTPQPTEIVKLGNVCPYCVVLICYSCSFQGSDRERLKAVSQIKRLPL
jgi:hypothetical protein